MYTHFKHGRAEGKDQRRSEHIRASNTQGGRGSKLLPLVMSVRHEPGCTEKVMGMEQLLHTRQCGTIY
eukprot:scaffold137236_cov23-Tisochrysis_lutea.AAC.1